MSTLSDLFASVRAYFTDNGWTTEILVGRRHLNEEGAADRIVFVPDALAPEMGPIKMTTNGIAKMTAGCTAYLWGYTDDDDDAQRFVAADALVRRLLNAFAEDASGRVTMRSSAIDDETKIVDYGEQYRIAFDFTYQIDKLPDPDPLPGTARVVAVANVVIP